MGHLLCARLRTRNWGHRCEPAASSLGGLGRGRGSSFPPLGQKPEVPLAEERMVGPVGDSEATEPELLVSLAPGPGWPAGRPPPLLRGRSLPAYARRTVPRAPSNASWLPSPMALLGAGGLPAFVGHRRSVPRLCVPGQGVNSQTFCPVLRLPLTHL